KNKNVLISFESSSLGDTLAWFPYVEEFRKKHGCNIYVSTFKNEIFKNQYPEINLIPPGKSVENLFALYRMGWFYINGVMDNLKHPREFKNIPLQQTASDILGLEYESIAPKISLPKLKRPIEEPYVCIAMHSTAQAKYWNNPKGWQDLTNWFKSRGYKVVMLSREENGYMGNFYPEGVTLIENERTLENAINYLQHSEMFVGIGSGLSWLSWSVGIRTVIISGFSSPLTEAINDRVLRVFNPNSCNSCFNRHKLDAGDWNWCPDYANTNKQFECTKSITPDTVIKVLDSIL
ncbi:MAG: autotransporter strand-loop-strand O-heptosyltransferase, partial [Alphaproteobacteria bacterium]|nr:autotransporter strand-loop-strand O-heptosyltransferase [Alphaproteobacteria bacterium]